MKRLIVGLILLVGVVAPALAAINPIVQTTQCTITNGTTCTANFPSAPADGSALFAILGTSVAPFETSGNGGVSGGASLFTLGWSRTEPSAGGKVEIWRAVGVGVGAGQTAISCKTVSTANAQCIFVEATQIRPSGPFDGSANTSGTSTTAASGTITTTYVNDLVITGFHLDTTDALGSYTNGFTQYQQIANVGNLAAAYKVTNAAGSQSSAATITGASQAWNGVIAAYKASTPTITIIPAGNGSGTVTDNQGGLNCVNGTGTCTFTYTSGTNVVMTPTATSGRFAGWAGDPACTTGTVNITSNVTCVPWFTVPTDLYVRPSSNDNCNGTVDVSGSSGACAFQSAQKGLTQATCDTTVHLQGTTHTTAFTVNDGWRTITYGSMMSIPKNVGQKACPAFAPVTVTGVLDGSGNHLSRLDGGGTVKNAISIVGSTGLLFKDFGVYNFIGNQDFTLGSNGFGIIEVQEQNSGLPADITFQNIDTYNPDGDGFNDTDQEIGFEVCSRCGVKDSHLMGVTMPVGVIFIAGNGDILLDDFFTNNTVIRTRSLTFVGGQRTSDQYLLYLKHFRKMLVQGNYFRNDSPRTLTSAAFDTMVGVREFRDLSLWDNVFHNPMLTNLQQGQGVLFEQDEPNFATGCPSRGPTHPCNEKHDIRNNLVFIDRVETNIGTALFDFGSGKCNGCSIRNTGIVTVPPMDGTLLKGFILGNNPDLDSNAPATFDYAFWSNVGFSCASGCASWNCPDAGHPCISADPNNLDTKMAQHDQANTTSHGLLLTGNKPSPYFTLASPAPSGDKMLDNGDSTHCGNTVVGSACDIGAFEFAAAGTFNLTVAKTGNGAGTITSTGGSGTINCGVTCGPVAFTSGDVVVLNPTPSAGSTFGGWSGTGCSTGTVTMSADRTCTASFTLTQQLLSVTKAGGCTGTVSSSGGTGSISCAAGCPSASSNFTYGDIVGLTLTPTAGCVSAGLSGDADCADGSVTMTLPVNCTATFNTATGTCADGKRNGDEACIDGGGPTCVARCATGQPCQRDGDCTSGRCPSGTCVTAGTPTVIPPAKASVWPWWGF